MAKSRKLNSAFRFLLQAQQALDALDALGIDVNRMVGISNAQGPQRRRIQDLLELSGIILNNNGKTTELDPIVGFADLVANTELPDKGTRPNLKQIASKRRSKKEKS